MKKWYKTLKIEAEILENLKQLKGVYKVDNMSQVLREMMYRLNYTEEFFDRIEMMGVGKE